MEEAEREDGRQTHQSRLREHTSESRRSVGETASPRKRARITPPHSAQNESGQQEMTEDGKVGDSELEQGRATSRLEVRPPCRRVSASSEPLRQGQRSTLLPRSASDDQRYSALPPPSRHGGTLPSLASVTSTLRSCRGASPESGPTLAPIWPPLAPTLRFPPLPPTMKAPPSSALRQ